MKLQCTRSRKILKKRQSIILKTVFKSKDILVFKFTDLYELVLKIYSNLKSAIFANGFCHIMVSIFAKGCIRFLRIPSYDSHVRCP